MRRSIIIFAALGLALAGCDRQDQNRYDESAVGVANVVQFGRVVSARKVHITGAKTSTGTDVGLLAGGVAGAEAGNGKGEIWTAVGGAAVGAALGTLAEREFQNRDGVEYIIAIDHGRTLSIVQEMEPDDVVFKPGDRVMVQQCEAGQYFKKCKAGETYQRVLPAGDIQEKVKAARKSTRASKSHDDADEDNDE